MFIIIFILIVGLIVYWWLNKSVENHQHWQHSFDFEFSAEEFYQSVQEEITNRKIPDVKFSRVTYSQGGLFSGSREYLHIVKDEFIYDVCAAPYGTGFFVSLWYVERPAVSKKLMKKVPALEKLADSKSYYQIDTDGMAKGAIHSGFNAAMDKLTTAKGARALSETQRKFL
jgi:hypothetical protein